MINGNIDEFVDKLLDGEEVIYTYQGKKYFRRDIILRMEYIILNYSNGNRHRLSFGLLRDWIV